MLRRPNKITSSGFQFVALKKGISHSCILNGGVEFELAQLSGPAVGQPTKKEEPSYVSGAAAPTRRRDIEHLQVVPRARRRCRH